MSMQLVYTAKNYLDLLQIKNLLTENGVDFVARGESSMASGLAGGELPPVLIKNTIHVFEKHDEIKALQLIAEYNSYQTSIPADWNCPSCKELVEKNFAQCWNCGTDYPNMN